MNALMNRGRINRQAIPLVLLCIVALAILPAPVAGGLLIKDGEKITSPDGFTSEEITITETRIDQGRTITINVGDLHDYVASGRLTMENIMVGDNSAAATWMGIFFDDDSLLLMSYGGNTNPGETVTVTFTGANGNPWIPDSYVYGDGVVPLTVTRTDNDQYGTISFRIETMPPSLDNQAPAIPDFIATPNPSRVNTLIIVNAAIDDTQTGGSRIQSAEYSLDDSGWVPMSAADGSFDTDYEKVTVSIPAFTQAGVHRIKIRAADASGNLVESGKTILLAVYDPTSGFVTGKGWINSPPGAYVPDPAMTGKVSFSFVSKFLKGTTVPTGETEFLFKGVDFTFHSDRYEWFVIAGPKAQFKGVGTMNGQGEYGFILTVSDGELNGKGQDRFRIRIWETATGVQVYDSQPGSPDMDDPAAELSGGSITIHKSMNFPLNTAMVIP